MAGFDEQKVYGYDPITGNWFPLQVDHDGHITIHSIIEVKIHDGHAFASGYYNAALANNGNIDILVQNSEEELVTALQWACGGNCLITVYEGVTYSDAGTNLGWTNLNRSSTNTLAGIVITHTPTITDFGTVIFQQLSAGGTGGNASGANGSFPQGIFNITDDYLVRLTNISGTTSPTQLSLVAYQHDPYGHV